MTKHSTSQPERFLQAGMITFIFLVGLTIRLAAPLASTFPLNDGALFYSMIEDLQNARYVLPISGTYNGTNIPHAYPPLAFYLTGLLSDLTNASLIDLLRLLPAFVSGLCILAFYLLAKEIMPSKTQATLATFAFAMLPRTFDWLIMGGGITRSFGLLFALLTITFAFRLYATHDRRAIWLCILFGTLVLLTHPEATVHTAITAFVFYIWKDRSLKGLIISLAIITAILALSAPWWGIVISRHGLDPFLASLNAARQNSFNQLVGLVIFFRFLFADEPYLAILSSVGVVGFFASLNGKRGMLPSWLFALHFIEPRGGTLYMMIPLALLVGVGLDAIILPGLNTIESQNGQVTKKTGTAATLGSAFNFSFGKAARLFLIILFIYTSFSAYSVGLRIYQDFTLKQADLEAFEWAKYNTPSESEFLLITGQEPLRDAWSEWFPVLTGRKSQATVFGYEWVNDGNFGNRVDNYQSLQKCAKEGANCLNAWKLENGSAPIFLYLRGTNMGALRASIREENGYILKYESGNTSIYRIELNAQ